MKIAIEDARRLIESGMISVDHTQAEAAIIADHLIDCELRGLGYAGLARAVTIVEYIRSRELRRSEIVVIKETPVSAQLDGADNVGYLVAHRATGIAIDKAREMGMAAVGASKTYYTGMFSYYLERIVAAGLAGLIAGSGPSLVAPAGGTEPRFCTNPIAFGFPTDDAPVIWDIGTSSLTHAEVVLARRLGAPLPTGLAFDADGAPTTDAAAMLAGGALTAWGGHRGSGLALSIQMLAMMAGQANAHKPSAGPMDCGLFIAVFDPDLFVGRSAFQEAASVYAYELSQTRPIRPDAPVRAPFARSLADRQARIRDGVIEVPDLIVDTLRAASEIAGSADRPSRRA